MDFERVHDLITDLIWAAVSVSGIFVGGLFAGWWDPFKGWLY